MQFASLVTLATLATVSAWSPGSDAPSCASLTTPYLLKADDKASPSMGTSPTPLFTWAIPISLPTVTSVHLQVFDDASTLVFDSPEAWFPLDQWSARLPASGSTQLYPGRRYTWRVALSNGTTQTPFSPNATLFTGLWETGWGASIHPVWHSNASAQYVLFRGSLALPSSTSAGRVLYATAFATASPQRSLNDHENGKLLGAYKLYVEGGLVGLGPGRPGVCGPVCPTGNCTDYCTPQQVYDTYDITGRIVGLQQPDQTAPITLAISAFNAPGPDTPKVILQVVVVLEGVGGGGQQRVVVVGGTTDGNDPAWTTMDATQWFNPSCCTERAWFYGPKEGWDGRNEPLGVAKGSGGQPIPWNAPGYTPVVATPWTPLAVVEGGFFAPLTHRPTLSLQVKEGLLPATTLPVSNYSTLYDVGREIQGGVKLELPTTTPAGLTLTLQLGEELLSPTQVMYEMRTANNYSMTFITRGGAQVFEVHEYLEFRYVQVVWEGGGGGGGGGNGTGGLQCLATPLGDYTTPVTLSCDTTPATITGLSFVSWGTPSGGCSGATPQDPTANTFARNASCDYSKAGAQLAGLCVGKVGGCTFTPSDPFFGGEDPCHYTDKRLGVVWECKAGPPKPTPSPPPPPPPPPPQPTISFWQVYYPAAFIGDAQAGCPGGAAGTQVDGRESSSQATTTAATTTTSPPPLTTAFQSSSPLLNSIFNLCEYTVRATNLDMVTDSNTRQRSPVCAEAMLVTSADIYATAYESQSQAYLTEYVLNMSPPPKGAGWAEWQALLISSVHQVYRETGGGGLAARKFELLTEYLERGLFDGEGGLWACNPEGDWACKQPEVDWPSSQRDGFVFVPVNTVVNAHYVGALREYGELAGAPGVGNASGGAWAANASAALAQSMRERLFNGSAGGFVDGLGTTHMAIHSTVYSAARGVVGGEGGAAMQAQVWDTMVGALGDGQGSGIPTGPYPGYSYGTALFANTSDHGRAGVQLFLLNNGTNSWANQLRQGATTTMEAWDPAEKPNLTWSHPWMAFPLALMVRWVLGVRALLAGYGRVVIQPQLGGLTWVQGVVPSSRGAFAVSVAQTLGADSLPITFGLNVTIPGGVGALVCLPLPACGPQGEALTMDGVTVGGGLVVEVLGDYACVNTTSGVHVLGCGV